MLAFHTQSFLIDVDWDRDESVDESVEWEGRSVAKNNVVWECLKGSESVCQVFEEGESNVEIGRGGKRRQRWDENVEWKGTDLR